MLNFKSLGDEGLDLLKNMLPTKNTGYNNALNSNRQNSLPLSESAVDILSTKLSDDLCRILGNEFNVNLNKYDSAIDAVYNATHVGGSSTHHIVDGSHSLVGALQTLNKSYPDAPWTEKVVAAIEHLSRDLTSPSGINPLFSMNPKEYKLLKNWAHDHLGLSNNYINDLMTVNASEVIQSTFAVLPQLLGWKPNTAEAFGRQIGTLGVASIASANPLLAILTIATLASEHSENLPGSTEQGIVEGSFATGTFLFLSNIIPGSIIFSVLIAFLVTGSLRASEPGRMFDDLKDEALSVIDYILKNR